ncbi:MAG TPA: hypothetical protein VF120_17340, partial [Ktedonobacterales bacterium]
MILTALQQMHLQNVRHGRRRPGLGLMTTLALLLLGLAACNIGGPGANSGPTATPGPSPTPTRTVLYQNALTSSDSNWNSDQNCFFGAGGYHIKGGFLCTAPAG